MKLKMFGKHSLSTLLFYLVFLCLVFVVFIFFQFLPDLLFKEDIPVLLDMLPMLGYLGFLIPLALLLNTFRKEKIFTSKAVKYLNIFALFLVSVFKQGFQIEQENELTI